MAAADSSAASLKPQATKKPRAARRRGSGLRLTRVLRLAALLGCLPPRLGEQLLDLVHRVVDRDVDQILADLLRRRVRVAGQAVVDARGRVRIVGAAAAGAAAALRRFAAIAR